MSLYVCISFTVDAATNLCSWLVPQAVGPTAFHCNICLPISLPAEPSDRAGYGVGLRSLACWDCGHESRQGHGCISLASVVCFQVEFSASGWSIAQGSATECDVSECDREISIMRRLWPASGWCTMEKKNSLPSVTCMYIIFCTYKPLNAITVSCDILTCRPDGVPGCYWFCVCL